MPQFPSTIELSALDGTDGFRIDGGAQGDKSGYSVASAGDVNGDGLGDIVISAYRAGPNGDYSGSVYVVFGKTSGRASPLALASLAPADGFRIDGAVIDDQLGRSISAAGDVNRDGFDDLIIGAPGTDSGGAYSNSGSAYVVYGQKAAVLAPFQVSSLNGRNGFRLDGGSSPEERNHSAGTAVSSAGDVNGDGFADMIVGAYRADTNGRISGSSYVVFGRKGGLPASLDLTTLTGANGFRLDGPRNPKNAPYGYSAGYSVAGGGDINGDGFDDLVIGAPRAGLHGPYTGSTYVVFGKARDFASTIDLGTLNGANGFRLDGPAGQSPSSGRSVAAAGDVNGDGYADLIIGAHQTFVGSERTGVSYVVFGKAGGFAAGINLSTLNGANGFGIDGAKHRDGAGISVASAGDVNGDGFDDLIVGAETAAPNGEDSGASYVVFGKAAGFGAAVKLSALNGNTGFRISGAADYDLSGHSVASAGDVNGDGFDDLIVGAPGAGPNGLQSGSSFIVYGHKPDGPVNRTGTAVSQTLAGGDFADALLGLAGNDFIFGHGGADRLFGGFGRDDIEGADGEDLLLGGAGRDTLAGGNDADSLSGEEDNDLLGGGGGDDVLNGGAGADRMFGAVGDDVLIGGAGKDGMVGGDGADRFFFVAATWGGDTVADFEDGLDLLRFRSTIADDVSDFAIVGNGTRDMTLAVGSQTLELHGERPIFIANDDFQFFV